MQIMGDKPKIHPTAPLMSRGLAASEKGGSSQSQSQSQQQPPLPLRTMPAAMQSRKPQKTRSCCCKCICWTVGLLVLLLVIVGATAGVLYLVFIPKIPNYSVDSLSISDLRLNFDMSLYAKFDVKITATNPNKKIGIYYEKGGLLSVWYSNTKLCAGSIPKFYQGHRNMTKLDVSLTGQTQYGNTLLRALQEQQQTGRIPLDLKVDAPVSIKLGRLKLRKVTILGDCLLVVDSLSTNNLISIKASNCKFKLEL
ncbi:hypothetical protein OIU78_026643 [Salix suchowensis]|nr:hypothetical protein OIU78_026643 [Salix suchowensis]